MGEVLLNLAGGFASAVQPLNFLMIVVGLAIGIVAGALPGITMLNSIVLVLPFTYLMGIVPALLLMIGVYCGGVFGGSITGILFNIPGDPMNVPTTWEGYRLNRQGQTQYALGLAIMSSAFGGLVSALVLAFLAPPFARFALTFSTVEFFSVVVFGLASVSVLGQSSMAAALISLFTGMFLGTIGTEAQYGVERFAFGIPFLKTGVDFVTVLIGLFAIGEVLDQIVTTASEPCLDCRCSRSGRCGGRCCAARRSGSPSAGSPAPGPPCRRSCRTDSRSSSRERPSCSAPAMPEASSHRRARSTARRAGP